MRQTHASLRHSKPRTAVTKRCSPSFLRNNPQATEPSLAEPAWRSLGAQCREYQAEVIALCNDWGLRCAWVPTWLHAYFVETQRLEKWGLAKLRVERSLSRPPFFVSRSVYPIRVEAIFMPGTEQETLKEITKQARRQMTEIRDSLIGDGYEIRDSEPELREHIGWLYLHICPQEDIGRPWGWSKIAADRCVSLYTVRDAVLGLARELGIELRRLPGGAPRRTHKS